ncbi:hypothetical protein SS50377_27035 [Spironucleus salmonicida]|nr:hypothetical protein SS50377_27035 [Spironucleus salmonicida]
MNTYSGEPILLDMQQICNIIHEDIRDYNAYILTYSSPMLSGLIDQIIQHVNHDIPLKFEHLANKVRQSFCRNTILNQIYYYGLSLKLGLLLFLLQSLMVYYFEDHDLTKLEAECIRLTNYRLINNIITPFQAYKNQIGYRGLNLQVSIKKLYTPQFFILWYSQITFTNIWNSIACTG